MTRRSLLRALVALPLAPLLLKAAPVKPLWSSKPAIPGEGALTAKTLQRVHDAILFDGPWTSHEIHQVMHVEMLKMVEGARRYQQMFGPQRAATKDAIVTPMEQSTVATIIVPDVENVKKTA